MGVLSLIVLSLAIGGPLVAFNLAETAAWQRHEAYDADMGRTHEHIESGEIDRAIVLLRKHMPETDGDPHDYRGFEWYEMVERCRRRLEAAEVRFTLPVWAVAASPEGQIAVAPYHRGPVVLDRKTLRRRWPRLDDPHLTVEIFALAFTRDGRFLLSTGSDEILNFWSTATGERVHGEVLPGRARSIAVNQDGIIAIGMWGEQDEGFPRTVPSPILRFRFALVDSERVLLEPLTPLVGATGLIHDLAISPDGARLASSSEDGVLRLWNLKSGEIAAQYSGFRGPVMAVAFSEDGRRVCGAGGIYEREWLSGEAIVYDVESAAPIVSVHPNDVIRTAVFAGDEMLVTGGARSKAERLGAGRRNACRGD